MIPYDGQSYQSSDPGSLTDKHHFGIIDLVQGVDIGPSDYKRLLSPYSCTNDKLRNFVVDYKAAARKLTDHSAVVLSSRSASGLMATANACPAYD